MFSTILYPLCGLDAKPKKFAQMMAVFTLESFVASAMGLAVGSLAPSPEAAMAIGPPFMVLFIIFGGWYTGRKQCHVYLRASARAKLLNPTDERQNFEPTGLFVNADNVPTILKWVPKMSLIKWAFEGACITELTDLEFDDEGNPSDIISGTYTHQYQLSLSRR